VKKSDLRVIDYIDPMLNAVEHIGRYTQGMTDSAFLVDGLVQDAVIRNLEIVGEAARNIERDHPAFAAAHPDVPWEWNGGARPFRPRPHPHHFRLLSSSSHRSIAASSSSSIAA
jgi:uncharacterized protein with HEPN domain